MRLSRFRRRPLTTTFAVGLGLAAGWAVAAGRTPAAVGDDMDDVQQQVQGVLATHTLSDPAQRTAAAPTLVPLLHRQVDLLTEMADVRHLSPERFAPQRADAEATLYLLGDKPTVARIDAAAGGDTDAAAEAQAVQLVAKWKGSPADRSAVIDGLAKLDAAHPADATLTSVTFDLGGDGASPPQQTRLVTIATEQMKNPMATKLAYAANQMKLANQAEADAEAKQAALVGRPMTVAGPTVDGTPFSTADDRGKVVLVDFWATWCAPCKAELPHVLEVYKKYHDQGLDVVGVSGDFDAAPLKAYAAKAGLPWPQLFDAKAAATHDLNRLATQFGVQTLPAMFAIDRHGVCRSAKAFDEIDTLVPKLLAEK